MDLVSVLLAGPDPDSIFSRESGSRKQISLILFETWGHSVQAHAYFIENIFMFIPFGILAPFYLNE